MIDECVVVDMLSIFLDVQPVKLAVSSLAVEDHADVVSDEGPAERYRIRIEATVPAEARVQASDMQCRGRLLLQICVAHHRPVADDDLGYSVSEIPPS